MTRINVLDPSELTDQHLIAEYRELPRIFTAARLLSPKERVETYRMGKGHMRFFYDKTGFLALRQKALIAECLSRGFSIAFTDPREPVPGLDAGWEPSEDDRSVNLERLREKLKARPNFYRHRGKVVGPDFYGTVP